MSDKITRRDFLKITGLGTAAASVLTGCGPASRYIVRHPYANMPEFNQTGLSTYFATTCRECPAGCGLIVRTREGRALKVEGNPDHPVNIGKVCSRGLTSVQGLYNPDRFKYPLKNTRRGSESFVKTTWTDAVNLISTVLGSTEPDRVAFLLGLASDHLYDFLTELAVAIDAPPPVRYGALGFFDSRSALLESSNRVFGSRTFPFFDLAHADYTLSFGAGFLETWLSPMSYSRAFGLMRQGQPGRRGTLVAIEPRLSTSSGSADGWIPAKPGSEALIVQALGKMVAEIRGMKIPDLFAQGDTSAAAKAAGVEESSLREAAHRFANAEHPLAIPGGAALSGASGTATGVLILGLNLLVKNLGLPGGVYLTPAPSEPTPQEDLSGLLNRINNGKVNTLFIHGVNPVFDLPAGLGFSSALGKVRQVITFASFPDETSIQGDFILPDHTGLEAWGYQRVLPGTDRKTWSGAQPVVAPLFDTRSTVDVFLAAVKSAGGSLARKMPYTDEVDFLQQKIQLLMNENGGFTATEIHTFWSKWLQFGGWWENDARLSVPQPSSSIAIPALAAPAPLTSGSFHLLVFPTQMGDGSGANRPWLQETPDPVTTVMWGSWVEMNPQSAANLGIKDDDVVKLTSSAGSIEASIYLHPGIRPDTVAVPFGQGHSALGRYARGRGANPAILIPTVLNESGDLAFTGIQVTITPTGKKKQLSRLENRIGVYEQKPA